MLWCKTHLRITVKCQDLHVTLGKHRISVVASDNLTPLHVLSSLSSFRTFNFDFISTESQHLSRYFPSISSGFGCTADTDGFDKLLIQL